MEIKVFLTADFANIDNSGKLNILGIFDSIFAKTFPAIHPQLYIVTKVVFDWGEFGEDRNLVYKLFDPDGKQLMSVDRPFNVPSPKFGQTSEMNFITALRDFPFERPGSYELRLFVDKDYKAVAKIEVKELPPRDEA
ncbi:MAG: hypothetical protein BroJett018_47920 [Chloroflexota bacterium]|nr:hypothetical protein [Chloroflexota bacterium]GIK66998.1 MAG: hypothetical protein BroJett018_47920 [Chloroflexota bacterium]